MRKGGAVKSGTKIQCFCVWIKMRTLRCGLGTGLSCFRRLGAPDDLSRRSSWLPPFAMWRLFSLRGSPTDVCSCASLIAQAPVSPACCCSSPCTLSSMQPGPVHNAECYRNPFAECYKLGKRTENNLLTNNNCLRSCLHTGN